MGGLAGYIGGRLRLTELVGVDLDAERLKVASPGASGPCSST